MARLIILSTLRQYPVYQFVRFLLRGGDGTLAMRNLGGRRRQLRYSRHIEQRRTRHIVGIIGNIGAVVRLNLLYRRKVSHVPVPIPVTLAAQLAQECWDRPAEAPLLLAPDGKAWRHSRHANHHALFEEAIKRAGINPATTLYHLRHSSIVRMLLNHVPIAVVARLHDTSVKQIESHYGAFIADYSDDVSRPALLDVSTVPLSPAAAAEAPYDE
jgi:hypothetical protein